MPGLLFAERWQTFTSRLDSTPFRVSAGTDLFRGVFRAVSQFTCPFLHRARWHFLKENATGRQWLQGTVIVEPL
jgi:hypothetical protein